MNLSRWKTIDRLWDYENIFQPRDAIIARGERFKAVNSEFCPRDRRRGKYVKTSHNDTRSTLRSRQLAAPFFSLFRHPFIILPPLCGITRVSRASRLTYVILDTDGNEPPGTRLTSISHFVRCISVSDTRWCRWAMMIFRCHSPPWAISHNVIGQDSHLISVIKNCQV